RLCNIRVEVEGLRSMTSYMNYPKSLFADCRFESSFVQSKLKPFLRADLARFDEIQQRIVHSLHSEMAARLEHARNLIGFLVAYQIRDGLIADHDLGGKHHAAVVRSRQQPL